MKRLLPLLLLICVLGCAAKKPSIGLEVIFHNKGCSGIEESSSEVKVTPSGLDIVSNILSSTPCYKLNKAEISKKESNITVYFTFSKDAGECIQCIGVNNLVYKITGPDTNRTGIVITVIAYFDSAESRHYVTS